MPRAPTRRIPRAKRTELPDVLHPVTRPAAPEHGSEGRRQRHPPAQRKSCARGPAMRALGYEDRTNGPRLWYGESALDRPSSVRASVLPLANGSQRHRAVVPERECAGTVVRLRSGWAARSVYAAYFSGSGETQSPLRPHTACQSSGTVGSGLA